MAKGSEVFSYKNNSLLSWARMQKQFIVGGGSNGNLISTIDLRVLVGLASDMHTSMQYSLIYPLHG